MKPGASDIIRITVEPEYQENYSDPKREDYVFFYRIILENHGNSKISLLGKYSEVLDTFGERNALADNLKEPLEVFPGQIETLDCSCSLRGQAGILSGHFEVAFQNDLKIIDIPIPTTELYAKTLLN